MNINTLQSKFDFTGSISVTPLDKKFGTPSHGINTIKENVFGLKNEENDEIFFWCEFSRTNIYEYIEYNSERNYEGKVYDEWYFRHHKAYREIFMILEPVESIEKFDKNFIIRGIGRLYNYPYANQCLIDIIYKIEKINGKYIITKIEWKIPKKIYNHWVEIQKNIRKNFY
jgi:hypothetical protein